MPEPVYLAVDCSTTAAKAVAFTPSGRSVGVARRPIPMSRPHPGWHEQDPADWWHATRDALAELIAGLDDPAAVAAICISHQRESFVCLDEQDEPLRPAILWVDTRASREIAEYGTGTVAELSGKPADVTPALYKLAWVRRHEPDVLRRAARVGDVQAVLARRLTGRWATGYGSADTLGLFDLRRLDWSEQLLGIAGVRRDQLPELVPSAEPIGPLLPAVAAELGLPGPVPLVAGTGDGQAAGVGADAGAPGAAYLNLGTSMVTGVASRRCLTDPAFRTLAGPVQGSYVLETLLNSAGYLVEWFRTEFADATEPAQLSEAAARVPPGCDGLLTLPYWNAVQSPHWDPLARGATVGWHAGHTAAHFYRSLLEGVAYESRLQLDGLEQVTGQPIRALHAVGGGSRSALWVQILADVTERTVLLGDEDEVSAKGAAVLAHAHVTGAGNAGIDTAAAAMAGALRRVEPDPATAATYRAAHAVHRTLYERLRPVFRAAAG